MPVFKVVTCMRVREWRGKRWRWLMHVEAYSLSTGNPVDESLPRACETIGSLCSRFKNIGTHMQINDKFSYELYVDRQSGKLMMFATLCRLKCGRVILGDVWKVTSVSVCKYLYVWLACWISSLTKRGSVLVCLLIWAHKLISMCV